MIKNLLFGLGLMSLALASGCATGGNGVIPPQPSVAVSITSPSNAKSTSCNLLRASFDAHIHSLKLNEYGGWR